MFLCVLLIPVYRWGRISIDDLGWRADLSGWDSCRSPPHSHTTRQAGRWNSPESGRGQRKTAKPWLQSSVSSIIVQFINNKKIHSLAKYHILNVWHKNDLHFVFVKPLIFLDNPGSSWWTVLIGTTFYQRNGPCENSSCGPWWRDLQAPEDEDNVMKIEQQQFLQKQQRTILVLAYWLKCFSYCTRVYTVTLQQYMQYSIWMIEWYEWTLCALGGEVLCWMKGARCV